MKYKIKELRKDLVLTQQEFASHLSINRTTVHNWENNITEPNISSIKKLKAMCKFYDIDLEQYENI